MARKAEVSIVVTAKDSSRRALNRIRGGLNRIRKVAFGLKGALAGVSIALLGRSFIKASSEAESYRLRLEALTGSQEEANRAFKEAAEFAARVPFEYNAIMESVTALVGVMEGGVDEVMAWMPMIADLAAVSGLSIQDTTSQIVRMYSAGAAAADLFRERGILAMLGFQAGVSVSAEETRAQLIRAWEDVDSKFRGAADNMGESWDGMMSMISDRWFQFREKVGEKGLFDAAKDAVDGFLGRLDELAEDGTLDQWAQDVSDFAIGAVRLMGGVLDAMMKVVNFIAEHPLLATGGMLGLWFYGPAGAAILAGIGEAIGQIGDWMIAPLGDTAQEQISKRIQVRARGLQVLDDLQRALIRRIERSREGSAKRGALEERLAGTRARAQELWQEILQLNQSMLFLNANTTDSKGILAALIAQMMEFGEVTGEAADEVDELSDNIDKETIKSLEALSAIMHRLDVRRLPTPLDISDDLPGESELDLLGRMGENFQEMTEHATDLDQVLSDITFTTLWAFGDAISSAFEAMKSGSKAGAQAFAQGMLRAVGAVSRMLGDFYLNKGVAAIGEAIFGNPAGFAAAGKFFAASAGFYALAGGSRQGISGGGGVGGAVSSDVDSFSSDRGTLTLVLNGQRFILDSGDPVAIDEFSAMLEAATGRRVIIRTGGF